MLQCHVAPPFWECTTALSTYAAGRWTLLLEFEKKVRIEAEQVSWYSLSKGLVILSPSWPLEICAQARQPTGASPSHATAWFLASRQHLTVIVSVV